MPITYPKSKKVDQLDDYHGTTVKDPYRWLEASADTPDVRAWIEEQNALSFGYLNAIPSKEEISGRLTELWDYPKYSTPLKKGKHYFQFRNSGLQNQNVLYLFSQVDDEGKVLLDPNKLSDEGTVALNTLSISKDGKYLAYALSNSGSDWQTWHIREVETGKDLAETLSWSKFSNATWLPDSSGFFYLRFPQPKTEATYTQATENAQIYLHKLGNSQEEDTLIFSSADNPQWIYSTSISHDGTYLILYILQGTEVNNLIYYRKLGSQDDFSPLITNWEAEYSFLGNDGPLFYFQTTYQADKRRIIAIDILNPDKSQWRTLVKETSDTLNTAKLIGDTFFCLYMKDASHHIKKYSLEGKDLSDIPLPALGSVTALHAERDDSKLFFGFTSFLYPSINMCYDLQTQENQQLKSARLDFDPDLYTTRQVFAKSKDGTRVPMFLIHKADLQASGNNPCLLYGYGGFNVSLTPSFSVSDLVWLELGGILAVANLRGGGEYGKTWHEAGTLHKKQNVFDDFIACAEYLIEQTLTSPKKLAIQGGSNGGLLVGAVLSQRPELFAAALPAVGVMDMLRFHKFTIGWAWVSDYGSANDKDQFETLYSYSPLHNLHAGTHYPATLITTGDHDDRVVPAHSFKFAAALQDVQASEQPILIRIQTKAGHGAGKPTSILIEEKSDILAFLSKILDMA